MDTKSRHEARYHALHPNYSWQKWYLKLNSRLLSQGIMHDFQTLGTFWRMAAHVVDNYTCTDQRFSTGGANSSQPASGCVFLRHMCERSREEKRQRAAGTNPSATQITSGLSGHIGAQRAWWDMPPRGARQARWHTDTGAGEEGRKNRGWHILPLTRNMLN